MQDSLKHKECKVCNKTYEQFWKDGVYPKTFRSLELWLERNPWACKLCIYKLADYYVMHGGENTH